MKYFSIEILDSPEIRLFFVLFYLKNDPTWDLMGLIFLITKASISA